MNSTATVLEEIRAFCRENADPVIVAKYAIYFKEGYDAWGVPNDLIQAKRAEMLPSLKRFSMEELIDLGNQLWTSGKYEEGNFAIWLTINRKKEYTLENFRKIGKWLDQYIINWAHTDALCGEVLHVYIQNDIVGLKNFDTWRTAE